ANTKSRNSWSTMAATTWPRSSSVRMRSRRTATGFFTFFIGLLGSRPSPSAQLYARFTQMTAHRRDVVHFGCRSSQRVTWKGLIASAPRVPQRSQKDWRYLRYHQYVRTSWLGFAFSGSGSSVVFGGVAGGSPAYGQMAE